MTQSVLSWDEKRAYERIPATSDIWVRNVSHFPNGSQHFELGSRCKLKDISFGGAQFVSNAQLGDIGDRVELLYPRTEGMLSLVGTVVRLEKPDNDTHNIAMRLDRLPITEQVQLTQTLSALAKSGSHLLRTRPLSPLKVAHQP